MKEAFLILHRVRIVPEVLPLEGFLEIVESYHDPATRYTGRLDKSRTQQTRGLLKLLGMELIQWEFTELLRDVAVAAYKGDDCFEQFLNQLYKGLSSQSSPPTPVQPSGFTSPEPSRKTDKGEPTALPTLPVHQKACPIKTWKSAKGELAAAFAHKQALQKKQQEEETQNMSLEDTDICEA